MEIGKDVVARDAEKAAFLKFHHGEAERVLVSQHHGVGLAQFAVSQHGTAKRLFGYKPVCLFTDQVESGAQYRVSVNQQRKHGIKPFAVN